MELDPLIASLSKRKQSLGITTAASYLREFEACLDGACPSNLIEGISKAQWRRYMKEAERKLVYHDAEMEPLNVKEAALSGIDLPPHTLATVRTIITTTRKDRDGDVLETAGADLDPRASHLFNHLPSEVCGKLLQEGKHTAKQLQGVLSIMDTPFGNDIAIMYEHGALRTSHGFLPKDGQYEPLDAGDPYSGWRIIEFKILEVSGVSIPSNEDAVPQAFSRNKFAHPLIKQWAGYRFRARRKMKPVGIDLRQLPPGTQIIVGGDKGATETAAPHLSDQGTCGCHASKAAVPYKKTPAAPQSDAWNANAATKRLRTWAGVDEDEPSDAAWSKYEQGFARVSDKGTLTGYSFPHHDVDDGKLVVNFKALAAGIAALNGGRGGASMGDAERKAIYSHLKKHYTDSFPDAEVPELKTVAVTEKGLYLDFENSWDDIRCDLSDTIKPYLIETGHAGAADCVYIAEMFQGHALVCVIEDALYPNGEYGCFAWGSDDDRSYYQVDWSMGKDDEPVWTGEPAEVKPTLQLTAVAERSFRAMFGIKAPVTAGHLKKLAKASDHLQSVIDHDDATAGVAQLAKRAQKHVKAVADAHGEKGLLTGTQAKRLTKAMGYCSTGAEHADTTAPLKKSFTAAKGAIGSVLKDMDMGDAGEASAHGLTDKSAGDFSQQNQSRLKGAASMFRAVADDSDAHGEVRTLGRKGAIAVNDLLDGYDDASDWTEDGQYTGDDMTAYTAAGASGDGKSAQPLSDAHKDAIKTAIGHGTAIAKHEKATDAHKGLANGAVTKLKAVLGASGGASGDTNNAQDDDDGDMSLHGGNPVNTSASDGKAIIEAGQKWLQQAGAHYALTNDSGPLEEMAAQIQDTTTAIERRRKFDAEESALAELLTVL